MPRGPRGEKRPADVIGNAVYVMRIATGELEDTQTTETARSAGLKGARARSASLTPQRRAAIAKKAAKTRWKKTAKKRAR